MSRPATDDPFAVLALPRTFRLDSARIRAAQIALLAQHHPDRAVTPTERSDAARAAAAINAAGRVLADPLARGRALLRLLGGEPTDRLPPAFLADAMEMRELLDEALAGADAERVDSIRAEAVERRDATLARLADSFDAAIEPGTSAKPALVAASEALAELRYVGRLIERCEGGGDDDGAEGAGA